MNADHTEGFGLMMNTGKTYSYAYRMAEAWLDGDHVETARLSAEIEQEYGRTALNHVGELAVVIAAQS